MKKETQRLRKTAIGLLGKGVRCAEIAREFNVTREWIRRLVPDWRLFFPKCRACGRPCSDSGLLNRLCRDHQEIFAVHGDPEWKPRGKDWRCACGATKHNSRGMCRRCYQRFLYATSPGHGAQRVEAAKRWAANNPERRREMDRRAHAKYLAKKRALREGSRAE